MFTISLKSGDLETIHEMYSHIYTNLELPVLRTKSDIDWWPVQTHEGPPTSAFASLPVSFVLWPRAKIFFQEVGENMALEGF